MGKRRKGTTLSCPSEHYHSRALFYRVPIRSSYPSSVTIARLLIVSRFCSSFAVFVGPFLVDIGVITNCRCPCHDPPVSKLSFRSGTFISLRHRRHSRELYAQSQPPYNDGHAEKANPRTSSTYGRVDEQVSAAHTSSRRVLHEIGSFPAFGLEENHARAYTRWLDFSCSFSLCGFCDS